MTRDLSDAQRDALRAGKQLRLERARRLGPWKHLSYRLQLVVLAFLVRAIRCLPLDFAARAGEWLGRRLLARRLATDAVVKTIRVAFPSASDAEVAGIVSEMSGNIVRVVVELAHLDAFARPESGRIRIVGAEWLAKARAGGRGVLFVVGHVANWEISAIPLRQLGLDGVFSVMPPSNPYVFDWLSQLRLSVGFSEQANAGEGVYRAFRKALKEGRAAIVLADQRIDNGIKAPFFGVDAMTNVIPARLARTLGVDVVPIAVRRRETGRSQFEVELMPPLEFSVIGDTQADERAFTARINAFYEAEIRRAPGQWLWLDRRWDEH